MTCLMTANLQPNFANGKTKKGKIGKQKRKNTHFSIESISSLQANYIRFYFVFFCSFFSQTIPEAEQNPKTFSVLCRFLPFTLQHQTKQKLQVLNLEVIFREKPTKFRNKTFCEFFRFVSKLSEKKHLGLEFGGNFARGSTISVCVFLMCFLT